MHQDVSDEENGETGLVLTGVHVQRGHETLQFGRSIIVSIKSVSNIIKICCIGLPIDIIHEIYSNDKRQDDGIDQASQLFLDDFLFRSQLGEVDDFLVRQFHLLPHRIMVVDDAFFRSHIDDKSITLRALYKDEKEENK